MSLYSYILVLYYVHQAINFHESTFYFNFTATFTTPRLRQKTLFFLLIIKLISPLPLLRQDLQKLHIFISLVLALVLLLVLVLLILLFYYIHVFYYLRHVMIKIIFSFLYCVIRHDQKKNN